MSAWLPPFRFQKMSQTASGPRELPQGQGHFRELPLGKCLVEVWEQSTLKTPTYVKLQQRRTIDFVSPLCLGPLEPHLGRLNIAVPESKEQRSVMLQEREESVEASSGLRSLLIFFCPPGVGTLDL